MGPSWCPITCNQAGLTYLGQLVFSDRLNVAVSIVLIE